MSHLFGITFGFFLGFALSSFLCFTTGLILRFTLRLFFRCETFRLLWIAFYKGAFFTDFDLHRFTFPTGALNA